MIQPYLQRMLVYRCIRDNITVEEDLPPLEWWHQFHYDSLLWDKPGYHDTSPVTALMDGWFTHGYCLTCKRSLSFPDGTLDPIQLRCIHCKHKPYYWQQELPPLRYRLWMGMRSWNKQCLQEFLEYLNNKQH